MNEPQNRRQFLQQATAAGTAAFALGPLTVLGASDSAKPAMLGGQPVCHGKFPGWPIISANDRAAWSEVLESGKWFRGYGDRVNEFERTYARFMGARHCVAVANGTSALIASLGALGVGPGDEVILPPYTFVATLNAVLMHYALPVFVDTDPASFQIDARKVERAITDRTAALLPVHIGGSPADLDTLLAVGRKHQKPVIEDACQAHLGEWRGRKLGSLGDAGCFSFQASKNWNCGEGGAVLCQEEELAEKVYAFHNNCRARNTASYNFAYLGSRGANLRLTEFQAALLTTQMARVEAQTKTRNENAAYLASLLKDIPGVTPARLHDGCTRSAWHLFMFRYQPEAAGGLTRAKFLRALSAEGVPCSSGYTPLNKESIVKATLKTKAYQRVYPPELLNQWEERNQCPVNDQLCQEAVWFTQTMLLGPRTDMDLIAAAVRKVVTHAAQLARA